MVAIIILRETTVRSHFKILNINFYNNSYQFYQYPTFFKYTKKRKRLSKSVIKVCTWIDSCTTHPMKFLMKQNTAKRVRSLRSSLDVDESESRGGSGEAIRRSVAVVMTTCRATYITAWRPRLNTRHSQPHAPQSPR